MRCKRSKKHIWEFYMFTIYGRSNQSGNAQTKETESVRVGQHLQSNKVHHKHRTECDESPCIKTGNNSAFRQESDRYTASPLKHNCLRVSSYFTDRILQRSKTVMIRHYFSFAIVPRNWPRARFVPNANNYDYK